MGLESMSGIALGIIIILLLVGWVPVVTFRGMSNASRHQEDRYSPSLHVVDLEVDTQEHEDAENSMKEAVMQEHSTKKYSKDYVARVRKARRDAIRRRQILVAALFVATVFVGVAADVAHFSFWFMAIPAVLLVIVLGLGARTSAKARAWEAEITRSRKIVDKAQTVRSSNVTDVDEDTASGIISVQSKVNLTPTEKSYANVLMEQRAVEQRKARKAQEDAEESARPSFNVVVGAAVSQAINSLRATSESKSDHTIEVEKEAGLTTAALSAEDIQETITRSMREKAAALELRERAERERMERERVEHEHVDHEQDQGKQEETTTPAVDTVQKEASESVAEIAENSEHVEGKAEGEAEVETEVEGVEALIAEIPVDDSTVEVQVIRSTHALDAFEIAAANTAVEAESLEIISYKQVSKAIAPKHEVHIPSSDEAADNVDKDGETKAELIQNIQDTLTPVEAPEASEESLGVNLDDVLARRRS